MQKTIMMIGGGDIFASKEEFYSYLKTVELNPFQEYKSWKKSFIENIKEKHPNIIIMNPLMPNKNKADYEAWKIWFERHLQFIKGQSILIGHSLGGIFLIKYLSENKLGVEHLIMIAAPFDSETRGKEMLTFSFNKNNLQEIEKQCDKITVIHSKDDLIVPVEDAYQYKKHLLKAELIEYKNKGHFLIEEFPEIENLVEKDL